MILCTCTWKSKWLFHWQRFLKMWRSGETHCSIQSPFLTLLLMYTDLYPTALCSQPLSKLHLPILSSTIWEMMKIMKNYWVWKEHGVHDPSINEIFLAISHIFKVHCGFVVLVGWLVFNISAYLASHLQNLKYVLFCSYSTVLYFVILYYAEEKGPAKEVSSWT